MRARALVHIAGSAGGGKTTFIERLLEAEAAFAICVRAEHDAKLRDDRESKPKGHAELRRYREAGAGAAAVYRFAGQSVDGFFSTRIMQEYSEAVFIEGDCPVDFVDLAVFVALAPAQGRTLLRRVTRDRAQQQREPMEQLDTALLARVLGSGLREPTIAMMLLQPDLLDALRRSMKVKVGKARRAIPSRPTERWALEDGYRGIEMAQLIVVNARTEAERRAAAALVEDVSRLRRDEEIFRDIAGPGASKLPFTIVVADLSNPKDAGLRKAVARVKRTMKRSSA